MRRYDRRERSRPLLLLIDKNTVTVVHAPTGDKIIAANTIDPDTTH